MLCLFTGYAYGLEMEPDSIVREIEPLMVYNAPVETLTIQNRTGADVAVDSITIRFRDGDSSDFSMGIDCQWDQLSDYYYRGWVYGMTSNTLRYVRDSLFLLQDSSGSPVTFTVAPDDSAEFPVWLIVNCPECGRKPSFPATERYLYIFHHSGEAPDSLTVTIRDSASTPVGVIPPGKASRRPVTNDRYDIAGRKLNAKNVKHPGIIRGERSVMIRIADR